MVTSSSSATVQAGTEIRLIYQTSTTSSSTPEYNNPVLDWLDSISKLHEAARQRQRAAWFAPQKVRFVASVPPVRRYQKLFRGHLFPLGAKK